MRRRVVDSNVLVVANGRQTNASVHCRTAAVEALRDLLGRGRIVVDRAGAMIEEYRRYCHPKGQPGVGDRFYREILMNYAAEKVERIGLSQRNDGSFADFPDDPALAAFDPSDRKFAAAARKAGVPVMNATDSGWLIHHEALARNGIEVEFVCGMDQVQSAASRRGSPRRP